MQSTTNPASPLPLPEFDSDRPVTVIPAASVATFSLGLLIGRVLR